MGNNQKFFVQAIDGSFKQIKDDYAITIRFDSQEDQDQFLNLCKELNLFKMELPERQEGKNEG